MKIAILGYGKEGQSAESFFAKRGNEIEIFDHFTNDEIAQKDFSDFDLVLRAPSVHPQNGFSSATKYFFEHCPCPIIGVTGTKGKGTTSSIITELLQALGEKVYLVGNIGNPALDILDELQPSDVVVYEMSSFQLWDLEKSPHVAVILPIEPDHLNVHDDYDDYVLAKGNIAKFQNEKDFCIYCAPNKDSAKIANLSRGTKLQYPLRDEKVSELTRELSLQGQHNQENAEAALLAVASFYDMNIVDFVQENSAKILSTLHEFKGLPHRLEFLRELNGVKYYDDNFCTNAASQRVAIQAFPNAQIVLIAGGRDKTDYQDLPEIAENCTSANVAKVILMGESGRELAKILPAEKFVVAENLQSAVEVAKNEAEKLSNVIVLMSPAAASFDMFENVYDRGAQFQKIVEQL